MNSSNVTEIPEKHLKTGLTLAEVHERQEAGQSNIVENDSSRSLTSIIRANVLTLFNGILACALLIIILVGSWNDAVFAFVLVANALIGILCELRAKRTLDALAIIDAPKTRVLRDDSVQEISMEEIVRDDVIELNAGDQVPVDGEILESRGLELDESILTGESVPVHKHEHDKVLAGTAVVAGQGRIYATAVGEHSYAQGITRQAKRFSLATSELQQGINKVLRFISWVIIPVVIIVLWSQMRATPDHNGQGWQVALVLAVAAVVGMIPQGLVLLTSLNFGLGSIKLAERGVLVQELPAVEILARVDSLCLDKTGTLTTGGIRLRDFIAVNDGALGLQLLGTEGVSANSDYHKKLRAALTALSVDRTNATARAFSDALEEFANSSDADDGEHTDFTGGKQWNIPFSSARKWSAYGNDTGSWILGAPEIVINTEDESESEIIASASELASQGLRVVALVHSSQPIEENHLPENRSVAALAILEEEIRPDAAKTLEYFREQNVRVRVISGDNPLTVGAIAKKLHLVSPNGSEARLCDARTLPDDMESEEFITAIDEYDVFGRVTPEQKRAMVAALHAKDHTVAMTGDGVNDTLALKDADLGIAMGNGAPATKAVAQLVLVNGKFSVLPGVMAEGRRIIANMERVSSLFLAKTTYAAVIAICTAFASWQYPFLPRQFSYIDTLTIGIPAFFIALGPNKRRHVPGFLGRVLRLAIPSGLILAATVLIVYFYEGHSTGPAQTIAILSLMIGALWLLSITARPLISRVKPYISWRVGLVAVITLCALCGVIIPVVRNFFSLTIPTHTQWGIIFIAGICACVAIEVCYQFYARKHEREADRRGGVEKKK